MTWMVFEVGVKMKRRGLSCSVIQDGCSARADEQTGT